MNPYDDDPDLCEPGRGWQQPMRLPRLLPRRAPSGPVTGPTGPTGPMGPVGPPGPGYTPPPSVDVVLAHPLAISPTRAHPTDAGLDLCTVDDAFLPVGGSALLNTGLRIVIPAGHAGLVCPRSGLAARHGLGIVNAPGVVDEGYTGTVHVNLINHGRAAYSVHPGDRVAQLLIVPVAYPRVNVVFDVPDTDRGDAGHGSTDQA